jgi:hypothetical protein
LHRYGASRVLRWVHASRVYPTCAFLRHRSRASPRSVSRSARLRLAALARDTRVRSSLVSRPSARLRARAWTEGPNDEPRGDCASRERISLNQNVSVRSEISASGIGGLLPPPRAPGLPGSRIILRKSGKPDLRWGRVGEGGRRGCARCVRQLLPPPPTPPQPAAGLPASGNINLTNPGKPGLVGGGEHTECVAASRQNCGSDSRG